MSSKPTILYTKPGEAPALATFSFLPIIRAFTNSSGIDVGFKDISLAGRILSHPRIFGRRTACGRCRRIGDVDWKSTCIIKLPNISASLPQLLDAVVARPGSPFQTIHPTTDR